MSAMKAAAVLLILAPLLAAARRPVSPPAPTRAR